MSLFGGDPSYQTGSMAVEVEPVQSLRRWEILLTCSYRDVTCIKIRVLFWN